MSKILFVDSAVRNDSRTRELANYLLDKLGGKYEHLMLSKENIPELTDESVKWRNECCAKGRFDHPYFKYAREFAAAEIIVIAAPFWDNSFPAVLKKYIEAISVAGLTFRYTEDGLPQGLCSGKMLYYVMTAGGPIFNASYGYGYIREMAVNMFGVTESQLIKAENLDLTGADTVEILSAAKRSIDRLFE